MRDVVFACLRKGVELAIESGTTGSIPASAARKILGKHGRPTKEEQENKGDNNHLLMRGTTGAEYLTARIARDRPDILERMKSGEFRSVRAAAIEAGITKPKQTWTAPTDIPKLVRAICKRYNETERDILKALI